MKNEVKTNKLNFIFGSDYFLLNQKIIEISEKNEISYQDAKKKNYNFEDEKSYINLFTDLRTSDLWKKKIIIIKFKNFVFKNKKLEKNFIANLQKSPHLVFLITENEKNKIVEKKLNFLQIHQLKKITKATIKKRILQILSKNHLVYEKNIIPFLTDNLPKEIGTINLEIEKIVLWQKKTNQIIKIETCKKIINFQLKENIFDLIEAIFEQNKNEIESYIKKFINEMFNPLLIFQTLSTYLILIKRIIWYQKKNLTFNQIVIKIKKNVFFISKLLNIIKKTDDKKINKLIEKIYNLDREIKRMNISEKSIITLFLLNIF